MRAWTHFYVFMAMSVLCGCRTFSNAADVEWLLRAEAVGAQALPFQAVRVRVTVENVGSSSYRGVLDAANVRLVEIRFPAARELERVRNNAIDPEIATDGSAFETRAAQAPVRFGPAEASIAEFPLGLFPTREGLTALFPAPGAYWLRFRWRGPAREPSEPSPEIFSDRLRIVIAEPEAEDLEIFKMLQQDYELAKHLVHARTPPPDALLPKLKQIVKEHRQSSYARYAQFAIARHLAHGMEVSDAPQGERALALYLIEPIDPETFAYGDYVLAYRRVLSESVCMFQKTREAEWALDDDYPNSIIRLEDLAHRLPKERWQKLNPRAPVKVK